MKLFRCQSCAQVLHFENTECLRCGHKVGYLADTAEMVSVEPEGPVWRIVGDEGAGRWRFCRNWEFSACNWLLPADDSHGDYCLACRHNRTVPDLSDPDRHARWQRIETAKRRLIQSLLHLGLPVPAPGDGAAEPLVFDFLADDPAGGSRVLTGHDSGVITISLTEADDLDRERMRQEMGEAYRTLLGHFRHEVGHFYWDLLVRDGGQTERFRAMFGDESQDYGAAMQRHYEQGPPPDWGLRHVSAYATMHPWEDWAETWAHYLHILDTLETAAAFGLKIDPEVDAEGDLTAEIDLDPFQTRRASRLIAAWLPLTVALNALNRSMGQPDLYPFALPPAVIDKLAFVHDLVLQARRRPDAAAAAA